MPNLLNNLLRNIRLKERPTDSIEDVAKSMNIDFVTPTYLTKIENGDLKKPKSIEPIAKAYSDGAVNWVPLLTLVDEYVRHDIANNDPPIAHFKDVYKLFVGSPFSRWVFGPHFDGLTIEEISVRSNAIVSANNPVSRNPSIQCVGEQEAHILTFGTPCAVLFYGVVLLINPILAPVMTASPNMIARWNKAFDVSMANLLMPLDLSDLESNLDSEEGGLHMQETFDQKEPPSLD